MMKPVWEEEWTLSADRFDGCYEVEGPVIEDDGSVMMTVGPNPVPVTMPVLTARGPSPATTQEARARLAAAAPEMARTLAAIVAAELLPEGLEAEALAALRKAGVR